MSCRILDSIFYLDPNRMISVTVSVEPSLWLSIMTLTPATAVITYLLDRPWEVVTLLLVPSQLSRSVQSLPCGRRVGSIYSFLLKIPSTKLKIRIYFYLNTKLNVILFLPSFVSKLFYVLCKIYIIFVSRMFCVYKYFNQQLCSGIMNNSPLRHRACHSRL